jgi:hypothetical protein
VPYDADALDHLTKLVNVERPLQVIHRFAELSRMGMP